MSRLSRLFLAFNSLALYSCIAFVKINVTLYIYRFRNTSPECELNADIVPPFRDDVQLTVSEYRSKLYEIMSAHEKNGYVGKRLDKKYV